MEWSPVSNKLSNISKIFQFVSGNGAIQASITNADTNGNVALLGNNGKNIPLTVTFNNLQINGSTATTVVPAATAKIGGTASLVISAGNVAYSPTDYAGDYSATVAVLFEPVITTL